MPTIISILSDQPIPNVIFIKDMAKINDKHIFIETEKTKNAKYRNNIVDACQIKICKSIFIDTDSANKMYEQLNECDWDKNEDYIVSITGGNKLMSQMVYTYFITFPSVQIYYYPINATKKQKLHPEIQEIEISANANLDMETYFKAFGFNYIKQNELSRPFTLADGLFNEIMQCKKIEDVKIISEMNKPGVKDIDRQYYTGHWFEEWVYTKLKTELKLEDREIAFNVKFKKNDALSTTESKLESDVVFIKDNKVGIIECKVMANIVKGNKLAVPLHKIASIGMSFGFIQKYVVILGNLSNDSQSAKNLIDQKKWLQIKEIFSLKDFSNEQSPIKLIAQSFS